MATLTEAELLSIDRLPTSDEGRGLPAWRVNLGYDRNWTPLATGWGAPILITEWGPVSLPSDLRWTGVAYGNGLFVAVAKTATNTATTIYATSPDGITWTQQTFAVSRAYDSIAFGNGVFVVTWSGTGVMTSTDGITWTLVGLASLTSGNCDIVFANGLFMIPSSAGILTSPDGSTWTTYSVSFAPSGTARRIDYGGGNFVLSGDVGMLVSGDNGIPGESA